MNQIIRIFYGWWWFNFLSMFIQFLIMRIIDLCSFWSSIFRFIFQYWDFLNRSQLFVGEDTISDVLLYRCSFYGVILIDYFYWLTYDLLVYRQSIIIINTVRCKDDLFWYNGIWMDYKSFVLFSIFLDIIDLYLDLYIFHNKSSLDLDLKLNQIVVLKEPAFDNEPVAIIRCV